MSILKMRLNRSFYVAVATFYTDCVVTLFEHDNNFHNMPYVYEPRCEKIGLRGSRPGPTQTGLYSLKRWLEA